MFNERVFEGTNYSVSLTGDLLFDDQNIITDYDRNFIDQLLFLDDIKVIYVGRKQDGRVRLVCREYDRSGAFQAGQDS